MKVWKTRWQQTVSLFKFLKFRRLEAKLAVLTYSMQTTEKEKQKKRSGIMTG